MRRLGLILGLLLLPFVYVLAAENETAPITVRLAPGQSVYIVALDTSRRTDLASTNLAAERDAKQQFVKEKRFNVASTLKGADFVFLIALDKDSKISDQIAIVLSPADYQANRNSLEAMRDAALWQADAHFKVGRHAALAGATLGASAFFDPNVTKGLVKQFHKELRGK